MRYEDIPYERLGKRDHWARRTVLVHVRAEDGDGIYSVPACLKDREIRALQAAGIRIMVTGPAVPIWVVRRLGFGAVNATSLVGDMLAFQFLHPLWWSRTLPRYLGLR
jgi:hypothetical protein